LAVEVIRTKIQIKRIVTIEQQYLSLLFLTSCCCRLNLATAAINQNTTGVKLWEAEREGTTRVVVADKKAAERQFAVQLAVKAVEKMTHLPLQFESRIAVERLVGTLPNR